MLFVTADLLIILPDEPAYYSLLYSMAPAVDSDLVVAVPFDASILDARDLVVI